MRNEQNSSANLALNHGAAEKSEVGTIELDVPM